MKLRKIVHDKEILRQIVKTSKAIRQKHRLLKEGKETSERAMQDVFKPIVTPLEKLVDRSFTHEIPIKQEIKVKTQQDDNSLPNTSDAIPKNEESNRESDLADDSFYSISDINDDDDNDDDNIKDDHNGDDSEGDQITYDENRAAMKADELVNQYLALLNANEKSDLDGTWGVRKLANQQFKIGNCEVNFIPSYVRVADTNYPKTRGLVELRFKKVPDANLIDSNDLKNYKDIIIATSAHKKYYKFHGGLRKDTSHKYKNYIVKMVEHTGDGILPRYKTAKQNSHPDYIYWDDPNELVDRLRLLYASQAAGNPSHTNEIISIIEELREANIIY